MTNEKRRNLLKVFLVGGAAFLFGKTFEALYSERKILTDKVFGNFRVIESNKDFAVLDDTGAEIIVFDKEGL